jgi:hypothetical protein
LYVRAKMFVRTLICNTSTYYVSSKKICLIETGCCAILKKIEAARCSNVRCVRATKDVVVVFLLLNRKCAISGGAEFSSAAVIEAGAQAATAVVATLSIDGLRRRRSQKQWTCATRCCRPVRWLPARTAPAGGTEGKCNIVDHGSVLALSHFMLCRIFRVSLTVWILIKKYR